MTQLVEPQAANGIIRVATADITKIVDGSEVVAASGCWNQCEDRTGNVAGAALRSRAEDVTLLAEYQAAALDGGQAGAAPPVPDAPPTNLLASPAACACPSPCLKSTNKTCGYPRTFRLRIQTYTTGCYHLFGDGCLSDRLRLRDRSQQGDRGGQD